MVRYMGQVDVARVAVPFGPALPAEAYAGFKPKNFVDELVENKWKKLAIAPSPECTDEEFLRRASLDAIGMLPTHTPGSTAIAHENEPAHPHAPMRLTLEPMDPQITSIQPGG